MIKLTWTVDGSALWVAINHIIALRQVPEGTILYLTDDGSWTVRETPQEILKQHSWAIVPDVIEG